MYLDFSELEEPKKTLTNRNGRKLNEKDIEAYGSKKFAELGWSYEKFSSPQKSSVPDRLCGTHGIAFFIELKRPGASPNRLQMKDHQSRREDGFLVFVADCYEEIDLIVEVMVACITSSYPLSPEEYPQFLLT